MLRIHHTFIRLFMNLKQALNITNFIYLALLAINSQGTSFPGKILQKIYPNFLEIAQKYVEKDKFAITGTNGKTTTSGLLSSILKEEGRSLIHNELGANMPAGIATSLALGLKSLFDNGKKSVNSIVIEADEAYLASVFKKIKFDYLLVTNLFRDQLDRYGELDTTKRKIQEGIKLNPNLKLVLNADDACMFGIEKNYLKTKPFYFGFEDVEYCDFDDKSNSPKETIYCPNCASELKYTKRFYSQLGLWHCPCKNKRAQPDASATVKVFRNYSILEVEFEGKKEEYRVNLSGLYNAYNALGAIAMSYLAGIKPKIIKAGLLNYKSVFGREQTLKVNGKNTTIHLIKNPTGASEVLRTLKDIKNTNLMISINDNYADGRDISWLFDCDFEILENFNNKIYITGTRADDMAVRLKYAGVNPKNFVIDTNIKKTLDFATKNLMEDERLLVLTTYTSLLKLNKITK